MMTMTQKILAHRTGREALSAGELIDVGVDLCFANDITGPVSIRAFYDAGFTRVFDPDRVALILDHFTPNKDIRSAEQCKTVRNFAAEQGITHFYADGEAGIEHALLPEKGLIAPGDIVIGADSHTCTYGALGAFSTGMGSTDIAAAMAIGRTWLRVPGGILIRLTGQFRKNVSGKDLILYILGKLGVSGALYKSIEFTGAEALSMDDRFTVANMAVEAGAKNALFMPDEKTLAYQKENGGKEGFFVTPDGDEAYESVLSVDLSALSPMVAFPHLPDNVRPASEAGDTEIQQVVIGSCTNGRLSDLAAAASVLRGKKVKEGVRCIIIPATPKIYKEALRLGYMEIFCDAGAIISPPTCGPCLGGHMGILAEGERAVSTTNRNFVGRMGHPGSEVYLASPKTAAASAVAGKIVPSEE